MSTIILRGGVEIGNARELVLGFLEAYAGYEARDSSGPASFDERDLRLANRGGARISAAEIAAILARRVEIERALRRIDPDAIVGGRGQLGSVGPVDAALRGVRGSAASASRR